MKLSNQRVDCACCLPAWLHLPGVIEDNFSPGPFSMRLSAVVYGLHWQFKEEGLMEDLKRRYARAVASLLVASVHAHATDREQCLSFSQVDPLGL